MTYLKSLYQKRILSKALLGVCSLMISNIVNAEMFDLPASTTMVTPLSITSAAPLEFGTVTVPKVGDCIYVLNTDSEISASGGPECTALSGMPESGHFVLSCGAYQSVIFEVFYTNTAPSGAVFGAPPKPADIDGRGSGPAMQLLPCDRDGMSDIRVGGQLSITPNAPSAFSGEVGTIRLEVTYD